MFTFALKKIGDIMLGDFKVTLVDRLSRVETKIDHLERDLHEFELETKAEFNRVHSRLSRLERLEPVVGEIQSALKRAGLPLYQPNLLSPGSPLKLTEAGQDLAEHVDGYNFIVQNREFFVALLEQVNPTTGYDVQETARKVLTDTVSHPIFNPIKEIIYQEGSQIEPVISVLSIILRDTYLQEHPEIKG